MSKRDDEMNRIEQWAAQQKALISEIFSALIAEVEADRQRNESNLLRMKGEYSFEKSRGETAPARESSSPRVVEQSERFLKAAQ